MTLTRGLMTSTMRMMLFWPVSHRRGAGRAGQWRMWLSSCWTLAFLRAPCRSSEVVWILGPVSWSSTTVKWWQFSQSNRQSTIGTQQTECHEALPLSANDEVRCDCTFTDDGNASWYSVCRVPMVDWRLDSENCCDLTVGGLHDTSPRCSKMKLVIQGGKARTICLEITQWSLLHLSALISENGNCVEMPFD